MNRTVRQPSFTSRGCTACWKCVEACPRGAVGMVNILWHKHAIFSPRKCVGCNICVRTCPNGCFKAAR